MDISNKTLGLLLVAAIVVSVGGTFFSLDKMTEMSATGYATSGGGAVNLTINSTVSIKMNDSIIDFGTCNIPSGGVVFDSNNTALSENNSNCSGGDLPGYMTVENDGNTIADVNVSIDTLPTTEYDLSTGAYIDFKTAEGAAGGCTTTAGWTRFAATGATESYVACDTLDTPTDGDQFDFYVRIFLPDTAIDDDNSQMGITFTATAN